MTHYLQTWLDTSLRERLDRLTQQRSPRLPAPQVLVEAPGVRFTYGDIEQPFHTASIGKNFVAVLIGQYVEAGLLTLDTPIRDVLGHRINVAALPAARGIDPGEQITVERLLAHRAGLPDPFLPRRGRRTACCLRTLAADPSKVCTMDMVLTELSSLPAVGRPDEAFHYTDGGYALLSVIAEQIGGAPIAELLRQKVFDRSGMPHTRQFHSGEAAPESLAPMVIASTDISRTPALSIGSVDGGAITTAQDLVAFQRALHDGRLISLDLLEQLSRPRSRMRPGIHYGMGFVAIRFDGFLPFVLRGLPEPVGGLGLTSTHGFFYQDQNAHVILNFHSTRAMNQSFQTHIAIARELARSTVAGVDPLTEDGQAGDTP